MPESNPPTPGSSTRCLETIFAGRFGFRPPCARRSGDGRTTSGAHATPTGGLPGGFFTLDLCPTCPLRGSHSCPRARTPSPHSSAGRTRRCTSQELIQFILQSNNLLFDCNGAP